ncbi:MAG: hypothetical protein H0W81_07500 [Chloroflexi bacterium]|nr:hypothetical protein [Chloroflexota bacterium]
MARPAGFPCKVVYSKEFDANSKAIEPDYKRLDDMMRGAEWVIARTEHRGLVDVILNPGGGLPRILMSAIVRDDEAVVVDIAAFPV